MSTTSEARKAARSVAGPAGREAAGELQLEPEAVGRYAFKIAEIGGEIGEVAVLLEDQALIGVINEIPDCEWAKRTAATSLATSVATFDRVARHTVALGFIFEQVEGATFGTGVPKHAWESYLAAQTKTDDVDGILGFLDYTNKVLETDYGFGPLSASFKDVKFWIDLAALPGDAAAVAGAISTEAINQSMRRVLRNGDTPAARWAAQKAVHKVVGPGVIGSPKGARAQAIVNEFIDKGAYTDVDELVARMQVRMGPKLSRNNAKELRDGAMQVSSRVRSATTIQAALNRPGIAARAMAAERLTSLQARGGRIGGAADSVSALGARRELAARLAMDGPAPAGSFGKVFAKVGVRAVGGVVLNAVLLPFEIRTIFTPNTKLKKTASILGAVSATTGILAVATSWTGVGGVGFGVISVATGVGSATAVGGDAANEYYQSTVYRKAYDAAYQEAAAKAYEKQIDKDYAAEVAAMTEKYEVQIARRTGVPRMQVPAAADSKTSVFYRFTPTAVQAITEDK